MVLIRHADVTPVAGNDDPELNAAGQARAEELRHVLADTGVEAIFVTRFQRSQWTARPVAADLGLLPSVIDEVDAVVAAIGGLPASSVALVVGHTDTLPKITAGLGGPSIPPIGATEFDHLFVHDRRHLIHFHYGD